MANLADVQRMLKQGDRKRAALILQRVLKENPSADAWYLAARMTKSPDKTQAYLQNALKLDPNHQRSRQALLQVVQSSAGTPAVDESVTEAPPPERERTPSPLWLRIVMPLVVMLVVVLATSVVLNILRPLPDPPPATEVVPQQPAAADPSAADTDDEQADSTGSGRATFPTPVPDDTDATAMPTPAPVTIQRVSPQVISDHFAANFFNADLNPATLAAANAEQTWTIDFQQADASAQVLLYPSPDDMTADQAFFAEQLRNGQVLNTYHTVALLYSTDLDFGEVISLTRWLERTPITAAEQSDLQDLLAELEAESE